MLILNEMDLYVWSWFVLPLVGSVELTSIIYGSQRRTYYMESHTSSLSWTEADNTCTQKYPGGHLASLPEPSVIVPVMAALKKQLASGESVWLGGKRNSNKTFLWLNGSRADISGGREGWNCNIFLWSATGSLRQKMRAKFCFSKISYFQCLIQLECDSQIHMKDVQVEFNKTIQNKCLILFKIETETTWYEARNKCLLAGGDLTDLYTELNDTRLQSEQLTLWIGARRLPWIWMNTKGISSPVTYSRWNKQSENNDHARGSCMASDNTGWWSVGCDTTSNISSFICEAKTTDWTDTLATTSVSDSSSGGSVTPDPPQMLYYIIGGLCGGLAVFIIMVVVLVVCLRKQKRKTLGNTNDYQSTDFQFIASGASSRSRSHPPTTIDKYGNPQASSGVSSDTNPYACSTIEDVIRRENRNNDNMPPSKTGNALRGLKKRLSWLMKRDPSEPISTLPSPPTTATTPDIVPDVCVPRDPSPPMPIPARSRISNPYDIPEVLVALEMHTTTDDSYDDVRVPDEPIDEDDRVTVDNPNYGDFR